jgi:hypothetical protein
MPNNHPFKRGINIADIYYISLKILNVIPDTNKKKVVLQKNQKPKK